jgi:hypothetical protein
MLRRKLAQAEISSSEKQLQFKLIAPDGLPEANVDPTAL